ncbi:alpha-amylase family glycosyl hydrolase [Robiginitalea sp. M366]|uniref:alpha-amylase family glycosyl hydrolase n=1 Tax=Robiginitalea aestuariiviva TaxID=3036903 RepID=UPI00240D742C|nr:alpha-amylase family glycosyl hydrolase [Robiginitalea aestuariiviva]MDG1571817.1 alpha-amylase family glycosyl hydrolase [Robiginitalea aestuariiviva]
MKKGILGIFLFLWAIGLSGQQQNATFSITPPTFGANDAITLTVTGVDPGAWGVTDLYVWAWYFETPASTSAINSPTNGTWANSDEAQRMTNNGDGSFSFSFVPSQLYGTTAIDRIGMLVKAKDGTGDKKSQDYVVEVGGFQLTLTNPLENPVLIDAGSNVSITASTSQNADFTLRANGAIIDQQSGITSYTYLATVNTSTLYELSATNGSETLQSGFQAYVRPAVTEAPLPAGLVDGINLDPADPTRATLVLYAPGKEFVHLIGDWIGWAPLDTYLMNRDSTNDRFWLELTGLSPQTPYLYQYLVEYDINIADPYATLVLDGYGNDAFIDPSVFPDLPPYPAGQTEAITVLRTGDPDYAWQVTDFVPAAREDLVVYELLIRDFDALHTYDAVVNRLDYLTSLGINAIELMPVSEFDGNESWGYNPAFHMALDKYYGTPEAFKQFVDACHARGIAVILDVVYNHATGQHPYFRMWNTSGGGTGGQATAENPFFNPEATHSYSVFQDFNHQSPATRDYVKQTVRYWIEEFHIDGMRWDLTKGFTQNCTASDGGCTDSPQADRIAVLKEYADTQWAADPDFLVIFEHLGTVAEESQWADYRVSEGKGILLWNKQTEPYNEATMGYHDSGKSDFSQAFYGAKGFAQPSAISYMESHDEERLMFKNLEYGNSSGAYNVKDLGTALKRVQAASAFFFTIPGPKMIWQFGELGYDYSIDYNGRTGNKPIRWDYLDNPNRTALYDLMADLITLKTAEPIFRTDQVTLSLGASSGLKILQLTDPAPLGGAAGYLTVIGNFGVTPQEITVTFQESGVWYEWLENNLKFVVPEPQQVITLAPGEFRLFANAPTTLFPDDNPPDQDSDGVLDGADLCPDTPLGTKVTVDGCPVFSLDPQNFEIRSASETCRSANNGRIEITAQLALDYTATLSGPINQSTAFSTSLAFENLPAGTYQLCITVAGEPDYLQCYTLEITQPEALSVSGKYQPDSGKLILDLNGAKHYTILINQERWVVSEPRFSIPLPDGVHSVEVSTDLDCQGTYREQFLVGDLFAIGQNPAQGRTVELLLNTGLPLQSLAIYTLQGQRVYQAKLQGGENLRLLPLPALAPGVYILEGRSGKQVATKKLILK